ncbi:MAG: trans-aconitate 2-methyltransferase [Actinomycetota bacterium]|nr:trans-aconitate 2-methyltransferase [Actinomycetota bacterium]
MWDPVAYQQYGDERTRPFGDLLARVRADDPRLVVDLGCGPGDQTASLLQRWPTATVVGVDSSAEMIDAAQAHAVPGRLTFVRGDAREWLPDRPVDVLVSNATLQWIPDHLGLLPALARSLAPGGWLAFQVPGNFDAPSHTELTALRQSPRWHDRLAADAARGAAVHEPAAYLSALLHLGLTADVWETTYLHVLVGEDAVLEWTKGTALRPVFAVLDGAEREQFVADYAARLRAAYPRGEFGTVFPFRRIFAVARRDPDGNPQASGRVPGP